MTIDAAFYGTVVRDALAKTSKAGKEYTRFTARAGDGDTAQFVSVMYLGADVVVEIAAKATNNTRIYVEGSIKVDEWTGQDGAKRHGLSCMSWYARIAEIGRNKPKRDVDDRPRATASPSWQTNDDDDLPF
jgi:single-stranded DNA-binding protein